LTTDKIEGASLSLRERITYGFGDSAANFSFATMSAFLIFFYTDVAGISAAVVGTMMLISRVIDTLPDIPMGMLIDKTSSRFGKARPWLLGVAVPYGIALVLVFTAPNFSMTGKIVYAFITYNLMVLLWSALSLPFGTLISLMTDNQNDQTFLTLCRMFFGVATALVVNSITLKLVTAFGGGNRGWQLTAACFGIVSILFILTTFFSTKERVVPLKEGKVPIREGLKALAGNKYWWMVLFLGLITFFNFGLPGITIYYTQYVLHNNAVFPPIMIATFLPNLIVFLLVAPLIRKIGKRSTVFIGFFIYIVGTVIILMRPLDPTWIIAGTFIKGFGFAPIVGTLYAFVADAIEYGEWKTGIRAEGLLFSAASFGQKIGTGISLAVIGWTLHLSGYVPEAPVQAASALSAITGLFIIVPLAGYALVAILLIFYRLDKEYPQIITDLRKRKEMEELRKREAGITA